MSVTLDVTEWFDAPILLPDGACEFAVGDVHGHVDQLGSLLDAMAATASPGARLTFLGDLIDRGPASLASLRLAAQPAFALGFAERTLLLGNHEMLMLLAFAGDDDAPNMQDLWCANGGRTTLAEAGLTPAVLAFRPAEARATMWAALGTDAARLVETATLSRLTGNLVLVHAGVDPSSALADFLASPRLDASSDHHPAWIREGFLDHLGPFEGDRVVVHGHTPEPRVLAAKGRRPVLGLHRLDGWRLGLDGGSYHTGIVAGAEFRDGAYRVFTASSDG